MQVNIPITSTVYKDNQFSLDTWRVESYYADSGACIVVDQVLKPDGSTYRQHLHQWWKVSEEPSSMIVGHIPKNVYYRPNEKGCIQSVDFSCNISNIDNASDIQIGLLLLQHNNIYISKRTFSSLVPSWCYFSMENIKATDFKRLDSTQFDLPNFSIVGGQIQFGYFTIRTTSQPQFMSVSGLDTWRVTVTHEDQEAIHQQMKVLQLEHNMTILQQELSQRLSVHDSKSSDEDLKALEAELAQARANHNQAISTLESQASVIQQQKEALLGAEGKALSLTQELKATEELKAENNLLRQKLKASSEEAFSLKDEIESSSGALAVISKEKEMLQQELSQEKEKRKADSELLQSFLHLRDAMQQVESQLANEQNRRILVEQELIRQKADLQRKESIYQEEVDANERDTQNEVEQFKRTCQHELDTKITQINEQLRQYRDLVTTQEEEIDRLLKSSQETYHVNLSFRDTIEQQAHHIRSLEHNINKLREENVILVRNRRQTPSEEEEEGYDMAAHMKDEDDDWEVVQGM
eukprot:TRINITY_DN6952_c1_g3_i1.p1 TRINITY_DN6952_c1_g3~~TRINITY_DN6952_c1_g3_i1.p1  ORF type:complete len:525 (-),score=102.41 TRINITY_DN6952_c1_g3_i1:113-1687(-)